MDNSNIIISVIIVLCIAAGVTAYGISEGDNAVFTDLSGFSPDSSSSGDDGIGNTTAANPNDQSGGISTAPASTGSSSSSGGSSSSGSSSGGSGSGGSSSGGGSGGSGSGGNSGGSGTNDGGNSGGGGQSTDIGYDASLAKAKAMAGAGATFVSSTDAGSYRIFYFKKAMDPSEQSNYTTDTFAISVDKATGTTSLY